MQNWLFLFLQGLFGRRGASHLDNDPSTFFVLSKQSWTVSTSAMAWIWTTQFYILFQQDILGSLFPFQSRGAVLWLFGANKLKKKCCKWKQALWLSSKVVSACFERAVRSHELFLSARQIPHFNFSGFCLPASPHSTCRLRKRKRNSCWGEK